MKFKSTISAGLLALGIAASVHATPSIDFVDRDDLAQTYSSVRCVATHTDGLAYRAASWGRDNVSAVPLADLLAGAPGKYATECTAALDGSHERYTVKLDAVKLTRDEPGNAAPEYDENGFGYGIKIPLSQTRNRCYDTNTRLMNQECLNDYYGNGRYVLEAYSGASDVTVDNNMEYSSNVGIFLKDNPRHPEGKLQSKKALKATSVASPFQ